MAPDQTNRRYRWLRPLPLIMVGFAVAACGTTSAAEVDGGTAESAAETASDADSAAETASDDELPPPDEGSTRLWVLPELAECEDVALRECMQVAETAEGPHVLFYTGIEGFTHEEGTSYVIDVNVTEVENPPADASSLSYTLVDIVEADPGD